MKKIVQFIFIIILFLIFVIALNYFLFDSRQINVAKINVNLNIDSSAIKHLSQAISFRTQSMAVEEDTITQNSFANYHHFLRSNYPLVFEHLELTEIGKNLLFFWKGKDLTKDPVLLLAHQDVVPVDDSTKWEAMPFSGVIKNGYIYGRGSLDDKGSLISILEALESLLKGGFHPVRSIYLAFGYDEETGGKNGAAKIADFLHSRKIKPLFILDEGGYIVSDAIKGISKPVALIGIAEKGYLSLKLTAKSEGGHASMPPPLTAVERLAKAITKLKSSPFKSSLEGAVNSMFDYLGPEMDHKQKLVFANRWIFKPLILSELQKKVSTNASIRTTIATTMFYSGVKDNVLPVSAEATINFRILPGDSVEGVKHYVNKIIADTAVHISIIGKSNDPTFISDTACTGFRVIQNTIKQLFPDIIAAPYLMIGATDSRHYSSLSHNIFRFVPLRFGPADLLRLHGCNERLGIKNYAEIISFYTQLIKNCDAIKN